MHLKNITVQNSRKNINVQKYDNDKVPQPKNTIKLKDTLKKHYIAKICRSMFLVSEVTLLYNG